MYYNSARLQQVSGLRIEDRDFALGREVAKHAGSKGINITLDVVFATRMLELIMVATI
jgi:hypothetical protein